MIFILERPLWLLLEDGREGECRQLGGFCSVDVEMERSGWLGQMFRRQGLALAPVWCFFYEREPWRRTSFS